MLESGGEGKRRTDVRPSPLDDFFMSMFPVLSKTMATYMVAACILLLTLIGILNASHFKRDDQTFDEVKQLLNSRHLRTQQQQQQNEQINSNNNNNEDYYIEEGQKPDTPKVVKEWPKVALNLGQISGVAVNSDMQPVIFHRSDRVWDNKSFNNTHHYLQADLGPIQEHTVLTLDPATGKILGKWGENLFYLPHGLTIDHHDNLWVTDVALHQAFKFRPGELEPSLTFGKAFQPGSGIKHLCKPTHIAIASTGEIFIADGYCNNRILKYNAAGGLLRVIPNPPEFLSLQVPHALALIESMDRLCIADRENRRVTCPRAGLYSVQGKREPALTIQQPDLGRIFGVAARGNFIYAVEGPTFPFLSIRGITINPQTERVVDYWKPNEEGFKNPHAIATCPNNSALYVVEIGPNRIWKFDLIPANQK